MSIVKRIGRIILAYLASALAVGLTASLGLALLRSSAQLPSALVLALAIAGFVAAFGLPGGVVGIVLTEWLRLRRWLFYGLFGFANGVVVSLAERPMLDASGRLDDAQFLPIVAFGVFGLIAGTVYWWIAGRTAGNWRS